MSAERRRRWLGVLAVGGGALLASSSPLWGTYFGRQLAWLAVERVEVSGAELLAPHEVLRASGIREGDNLLDEREVWEAALEAHPVIRSATVERRPPNTLRIRILEKQPVALVAGEALLPATGDGELLTLDPATVDLDLPIVHGTFADSGSAEHLHRLLAEVERLTVVDAALMATVTQLSPAGEDGELIHLTAGGVEVVLPFGATAERTAQLRAVIADLEARAGEEGNRTRPRVDLRFGDQVVVRPSSSMELS